MTEPVTIVRIAGDGVGPELVDAGSRVIEAIGLPVTWVDADAGHGAFERHGATAPPETLAALREHRVAIKGPFYTPNGGTVRSANHYIRGDLGLYACLRPLPLVPGRPPALLVRENVEDLYGAIEWMAAPDVAQAVKVATRQGSARIARYAVDTARRYGRRKVTVVHKANNLKLTEGLFLDTATEIVEAAGLECDEMLADTAAATLVLDPGSIDVLLTSNTLGDILSSLGAAVAGSLGVVGSLNSGDSIHVAEAGHGHAAELAGRDVVNPVAFFESIALLLRALDRPAEAGRLADALTELARRGPTTPDHGGSARTSTITAWVCDHVVPTAVGG